jgi:serine/threonine protein kinase HipA of HipAB toxin-antitoxin module
MTRRFDRTQDGDRLHLQSLGALAHFDLNDPNAYSYEQALLTIRRLRLGMGAIEEQFRRMVFIVLARNQDDHVKNIAFLMDRRRGPRRGARVAALRRRGRRARAGGRRDRRRSAARRDLVGSGP